MNLTYTILPEPSLLGRYVFALRIFNNSKLVELIIVYKIENEYCFQYSKNKIKTYQHIINFLISKNICYLFNTTKRNHQFKLTNEVSSSIMTQLHHKISPKDEFALYFFNECHDFVIKILDEFEFEIYNLLINKDDNNEYTVTIILETDIDYQTVYYLERNNLCTIIETYDDLIEDKAKKVCKLRVLPEVFLQII